MAIKLSIVIPVLNEAEGITTFLRHLCVQMERPDRCEILLVDGGSSDATRELALSFQSEVTSLLSVQVLASPAGRAIQMNHGAQRAKGSILYFVHADSRVPEHFDSMILDAEAEGNPAGCFRLQFDPSHWLLDLSAWFTRFNWPVCRGGDQSLYVRKGVFEELGGYNTSWEICEDTEFTDRLYKSHRFTVLPSYITTSSRRYQENGFIRLQLAYARIHAMRLRGMPPDQLAQWYRRYINS